MDKGKPLRSTQLVGHTLGVIGENGRKLAPTLTPVGGLNMAYKYNAADWAC